MVAKTTYLKEELKHNHLVQKAKAQRVRERQKEGMRERLREEDVEMSFAQNQNFLNEVEALVIANVVQIILSSIFILEI